jgi:Dynamin family
MISDPSQEDASLSKPNGNDFGLLDPLLPAPNQRKVLNIVDSLRQCGIDDIIPLPQLVVCGDQSSGKSSVLEAITEIPFPRKENLCTRFATEIVLRRSPKSSIATKIIPEELTKFKLSITNFDELPDLIDNATKAMGLGDISSGATLRAFTKDVRRLRAMVQYMNKQFAARLGQYGHKYTF